jgi:aryl-alcohol dehydrogenase-like predicted oxidoreductase
VSRVGLGLAGLGRPAYITGGRNRDLPADRSVAELRARTLEVLDDAQAAGVRYVDTARSYGRAEEFLAAWLAARADTGDLVVGSKWGYRYVGGWRIDAEVHEVKDHSLANFQQQYRETREMLGESLRLYQVHSATLESGVLEDRQLHDALARHRDNGLLITTSGPRQGDVIRRALEIQVGGKPLFASVQATWNLLEPSAEPALVEAAQAGWAVIVKEVLGNGRLTAAGDAGAPGTPLGDLAAAAGAAPDALATALALRRPWASVVLSGAVTVDQLRSNLDGLDLPETAVPDIAEPPDAYWAERSGRPWS